jgi:hypothetical protein
LGIATSGHHLEPNHRSFALTFASIRKRDKRRRKLGSWKAHPNWIRIPKVLKPIRGAPRKPVGLPSGQKQDQTLSLAQTLSTMAEHLTGELQIRLLLPIGLVRHVCVRLKVSVPGLDGATRRFFRHFLRRLD